MRRRAILLKLFLLISPLTFFFQWLFIFGQKEATTKGHRAFNQTSVILSIKKEKRKNFLPCDICPKTKWGAFLDFFIAPKNFCLFGSKNENTFPALVIKFVLKIDHSKAVSLWVFPQRDLNFWNQTKHPIRSDSFSLWCWLAFTSKGQIELFERPVRSIICPWKIGYFALWGIISGEVSIKYCERRQSKVEKLIARLKIYQWKNRSYRRLRS